MNAPLIKYKDVELYLVIANYINNGRLYIGLEDQDGENEVEITTNLLDVSGLGDMEILLNRNMSDDLKCMLQEVDLISSPIKQLNHIYGTYDVVVVNRNKLKEYDEIEYKKFEEYYKKKNESSVKKDKKNKDMER